MDDEIPAIPAGRHSFRRSGSMNKHSMKPHFFWQHGGNARGSTMKTRDEYDHMAMSVMRTRTLQLNQLSYVRASLHRMLDNKLYSILMGSLIIVNVILVIHETDKQAEGGEIPYGMKVGGYIFLSIYAVEIMVRFYVHRWKFFSSSWNILDLVVVLADIFAEIIKLFAESTNLPSLSILRIFRLARLLRLIAMFSVFQELQTMLMGFGSALKGVIWASLMLGVVLTLCSIVAVEFIHPLNLEVAKTGVYAECDRCGRAYETVAESNLTFIQQIIAGDSWGKITIPIIEAYPATGFFFLLVFGFIDLGVLNLILTVIVNAAEAARESNHDMLLVNKANQAEELKKQLKVLVADLDTDGDGCISLDEFMRGVDDNEDLRKTMALLDFQRQDAEIIYFLMDENNSGDVDYHEFIHAMITWKQESANTKLLFLKASIHDIYRDLKRENRILNEEVVGRMLNPKDIAQAVSAALTESSPKVNLQTANIQAEFESLAQKKFESLTQKLDQRWEQLQAELAKNCKLLNQVLGEGLQSSSARRGGLCGSSRVTSPPRPQGESGISQKSAMPRLLTLPHSCMDSMCEARESQRPRVIYESCTETPRERQEPEEKVGRTEPGERLGRAIPE